MEAIYFNGICQMELRFDSLLSGNLPSGTRTGYFNLCRQDVLPVYTPLEDPEDS